MLIIKYVKKLCQIALFIGISTVLFGQQFTMSGEVRPRTEFRNGFKTPTTDANKSVLFTEQRSRIYFDYAETKYRFKLSIQDVRIWGENAQIFKQEDGNTYLSEAWGQYFFTPAWSIKMGRQIISYDNQRFFGGLEWAQQGRRHDALLLKYTAGKSKFDIGLAFNNDDTVPEFAYLQNPEGNFYDVSGNYKSLIYGWYHTDFTGGALSLLAVNAGYQNADVSVSNKQTFGAIGSFSVGGVKFAGDLYYQTGSFNNQDVNALLFGLNAGFKVDQQMVTAGFEFISGKDDDDTSTEITNFSPDFGTNHAFNGLMDYFFVGPANGNVGVTDFYIKTKFSLPKSALVTNLHYFQTGSTQLDATGAELSKGMGTELDLVWVKKLQSNVTLNIGFSQLYGTDTLLSLRPGDQKYNTWGWVMFTFKPTFIKTVKPVE